MPRETLFRKMRPFTSPTSIRRSTPSVNASRAPGTSCRSTPTSSAKWLRVPAGMQTKGSPCAAATAATAASDPSPPAIPSASAPSATTSRTRVLRSSPGPRVTASTPRSRARSTTLLRVAAPSPDLGLTNSTGRRGGSTERQPRLVSVESRGAGCRGRFMSLLPSSRLSWSSSLATLRLGDAVDSGRSHRRILLGLAPSATATLTVEPLASHEAGSLEAGPALQVLAVSVRGLSTDERGSGGR